MLVYASFVVPSSVDIMMNMDIVYIVMVFLVIFVSMTLHELMHGLIAYRLGDDTARLLGRLTFNPLKHIDPFMTIALPMLIVITNVTTGASMPVFGGAKPVPFNPNSVRHGELGVALVAAGGPLVNLALAFVAYCGLALAGDATFANKLLNIIVMVNLGFFAFNIIPIPPLDGSRVLYALAPDGVRNIFDGIERYGTIFIFAIVMICSSFITTYMSFIISVILKLFSSIVAL